MTSDHDRLLAEGPRMAPEAPVVSDAGAVSAPRPATVQPAGADAPAARTTAEATVRRPGSPAARPRSKSLAKPFFGRAWLPLLFAAIAFASAGGHGYVWIVPIVLVGLAWFRIWRQQR